MKSIKQQYDNDLRMYCCLLLSFECCGFQDIWPKTSTLDEGRKLSEAMQSEQKVFENHLEEGCAVLPLLEAQIVDAACNDPGAILLPHLILPMLRAKLETEAAEAVRVSFHH